MLLFKDVFCQTRLIPTKDQIDWRLLQWEIKFGSLLNVKGPNYLFRNVKDQVHCWHQFMTKLMFYSGVNHANDQKEQKNRIYFDTQ